MSLNSKSYAVVWCTSSLYSQVFDASSRGQDLCPGEVCLAKRSVRIDRVSALHHMHSQDNKKKIRSRDLTLPLFGYGVMSSRSIARFVNAPGISSDQYFGRGSYDPSASAEAQSRLQQFNGASAISSNQYFGREDDDQDQSDEMMGDKDSLDVIERAAREMVGKVLANPDVQQLGEGIRAGALKVIFFLIFFFISFSLCFFSWP